MRPQPFSTLPAPGVFSLQQPQDHGSNWASGLPDPFPCMVTASLLSSSPQHWTLRASGLWSAHPWIPSALTGPGLMSILLGGSWLVLDSPHTLGRGLGWQSYLWSPFPKFAPSRTAPGPAPPGAGCHRNCHGVGLWRSCCCVPPLVWLLPANKARSSKEPREPWEAKNDYSGDPTSLPEPWPCCLGTAGPPPALTRPPFLPTALRLPTGLQALLAVLRMRTRAQMLQGLGQGKRVLEEKLPGAAPPPGIFILEENFED